MTPTEARAEIVERMDRALRAAWRADAELAGFDKCLAAMSPRAVKRGLRADVLGQLSSVPLSAALIRKAIGGRLRDVDRILRRMPLFAQLTPAGWVRVEPQEQRRLAAQFLQDAAQ